MDYFISDIFKSNNITRIFEKDHNILMFLLDKCFESTNDVKVLRYRNNGFLVPVNWELIVTGADIKDLHIKKLLKIINSMIIIGTWEIKRCQLIFELVGGEYVGCR